MLLVATVIYAGGYFVARLVMPVYIKPFGLILIRASGAVAFFWFVGLFFKSEKVTRRDLAKLFLCAVFGVAINQLCFFYGLSLTTPVSASIIMPTSLIVVLILSVVFLGERITLLKVAGVIVGMLGVVLLICFTKRDAVVATNPSLGDFMVFVNASSYAVYLVLAKGLMQRYSALTITKYLFLFGLLLVIPFGYGQLRDVSWSTLPYEAVFSVFYVVFLLSCLAYWLILKSMKTLKASTVGVYLYLQPLLSTLIAFMVGRRSPGVVELSSMLLIIVGVYMVISQNQKPKNP